MKLSSAFAVAMSGLLAIPTALSARPMSRPPNVHGDLSGFWSNASVTQLQRPGNLPKATLTQAEAQVLAQASPLVRRAAADAQPTDAAQGAPTDGVFANASLNAFWIDPGRSFARVKEEYRTSWIVEPASGRLPLTEAGRVRAGEAAATSAREDAIGPEQLSPNDRCLIGSRGSGGPGMLNNIYNSNYQIVQTPRAVVIVVEMVHDARIIPLFANRTAARAGHRPAALDLWLGDSVGWWEGDALVVETINVNPQQGRFGPIFLSPRGQVTERFRRVASREIFYAFQVEDPVYYAQPWRAEMSLTALSGQTYEYACHEGNYGLAGVLAGARAEDAKARKARGS